MWVPNIVGSALFYASGHLAFIEVCNAHWAYQPRNISWWIVFINLVGCIEFLISAIFGPALPGIDTPRLIRLSVTFTAVGAFCFLAGAILMLPELTCHTEVPSEQPA